MKILYRIVLIELIFETAALSFCAAIKIKCTNIDEFFYATPESHCKSYYKCTSRGQRDIEECEPGTIFDFYKQICSRTSGICYEPICTGRSNGIYQDTTHACRRSYTCHAGQVTNIDNCPPKHLHNGQKCIAQDLVSCGPPETTAIGYPFAGDQRCIGKANGYFADSSNCNEYIICTNEEVTEVNHCPSGYGFNNAKKICQSKQSVSNCRGVDYRFLASIADEIVCLNKRNGANTDPSSKDCTTYIMCQNGKLESEKRCSNQAVFNGESCVPSILYQCTASAVVLQNKRYSSQIVDLCHKKSNGFYISPQHGCSSYVRCMSGKAVEINECPAEHYFDADTRNCVFEKFTERRRCFNRGISLDCDGKANGFYSETNCQSYYYCHSGHKTDYKCSTGKIFNGDRCVSKTQYICPQTIGSGGNTICANSPDGYYKDQNDGCRSYNYCSSGHKITYLCEVGYTFDAKAKQCARQQMSVNGGRSGLHCRADFLCYGKSDGYHADYRSNCRNYVFCQNYEKITQLTCRDNNIFDGQKCVRPSDYACPSLYNHRQLNCMPKHCGHQCKNDGFYPDLSADCRDYYFCIGGKPSKLSCPLGKRFNGEICVAEDKFSCPAFCSNNSGASSRCPLGGYVL